MYLIIDRATHSVLHMSNAYPGEDKKPEDLLPGFDAATMDFGQSPEPYIPVRFAIEDGVVKDLDPPPPAAAAAEPETLDQARVRKLREFAAQSLWQRAQLIPDYQLLNAGLGLYDAARMQSLRATVQAFRDEVGRLEKAAAKVRTVKALEALQPAFPTALVVPTPSPAPAAGVRPRDEVWGNNGPL